jgi:hypothetical protein
MLAGQLACAPLTSLLCFHSPNPTHASGSLMILQLVSDGLAACHELHVPSLLSCVLLSGHTGMCPSD